MTYDIFGENCFTYSPVKLCGLQSNPGMAITLTTYRVHEVTLDVLDVCILGDHLVYVLRDKIGNVVNLSECDMVGADWLGHRTCILKDRLSSTKTHYTLKQVTLGLYPVGGNVICRVCGFVD
jgi:hypothetical protein